MSNFTKHQKSEHGGAGVKMTLVLAGLFLLAHAAYNYIPVAYDSANFKQEMQTAVVQAAALQGANQTAVDSVKAKLRRAAVNNNVPTDALIEVKPINNVVRAHVSYVKPVNILPFGIYKYNYQFDDTATPSGFLFKDNAAMPQ
jgi:Flp pilus assembly protein TadG